MRVVIAGTNTLHVKSIVAVAATSATQRVWSGDGATAAPATLSTLFAQVTLCGIAPTYSLEVFARSHATSHSF